MIATKHSKIRAKTRLGISKKHVNKFAEKALSEGLGQANTKGVVRKYLDSISLKYARRTKPIILNDKVYLFGTNDVLITILNLPVNLVKIAKKQIISQHGEKQSEVNRHGS